MNQKHEWLLLVYTDELSWCKHCGALRMKKSNSTHHEYKAPVFTLNSPSFEEWSKNDPVCLNPDTSDIRLRDPCYG